MEYLHLVPVKTVIFGPQQDRHIRVVIMILTFQATIFLLRLFIWVCMHLSLFNPFAFQDIISVEFPLVLSIEDSFWLLKLLLQLVQSDFLVQFISPHRMMHLQRIMTPILHGAIVVVAIMSIIELIRDQLQIYAHQLLHINILHLSTDLLSIQLLQGS